MMGIKSRRLGKFYITFDAIDADSDYVYQVMGQVIILHAEAFLHSSMVEYIAISRHFGKVEAGFMMPEYKAIINSEKGFQGFEKVC